MELMILWLRENLAMLVTHVSGMQTSGVLLGFERSRHDNSAARLKDRVELNLSVETALAMKGKTARKQLNQHGSNDIHFKGLVVKM